MVLKYSGKDVFKPGVQPPEPKIDTLKLYDEIRALMRKYGLETLEVSRD